MPIYEYTCKACHTKFEKLVKSMNSKRAVPCPSCGSKDTQREMSVFAVSADSPQSRPKPDMCAGCGGDGPCPMAE